jgi:glycosyltransferase involved in cell wall biosynthesis
MNTGERAWPTITVVTPSYNQARFLEQTIQSVLGQNYPALDYIIMDGGSTDGSVEIIKKYEKHLGYWQSRKDGGQSAAINDGFARARGGILGWMNSDDFYLPGALRRVAETLRSEKAQLLAGNCLTVDEARCRASASNIAERKKSARLLYLDYLIQPSTFWTRIAWDKTGKLDGSLNYAFDWDWFIRAEKAGVETIMLNDFLSYYRVHAQHKTGTGGDKRDREIAAIYGRHAGPQIEELFLTLSSKKAMWQERRKMLKKLGLRRSETTALKALLPKLTHGLKVQDLENILAML